jgi:MinD-like ATPase involved in chromosome partitioning or flagellar assembly
LTDNQAKPEVKRPYSIIDLTDLSKAEIVFNNIEKKKDVIDVVVIDGGANRELFDSVLSKFCDLIITPSTIDDPSLIATKEYVDKYDKCFVVVSGFSYMWGIRKSGRQQQRARTILGNERVVSEISHLENHTELTEVDRATFSRKIKSECRVLYTEVLGKFKK